MTTKQQRMTKQRMVILEELSKVRSHPTAYDVYEMVRSRLPQISLGTVYRNLEQLSSCGQIRRLDLGQGKRRFDAATDDHIHISCQACGRVDDVPLNPDKGIATIKDSVSSQSGYDILGFNMDFKGICPDCKKKIPCEINQA